MIHDLSFERQPAGAAASFGCRRQRRRTAANKSRVLSLVCTLLLLAVSATPALTQQSTLAQAQALIDAGAPDRALPLIEQAMGRGKVRGQALLMRSTARFMLGEHELATSDLRQAVEADPSLRQGWLNLAAVEMAVQRWDVAHQALVKAQQLDPTAPDNDLNLGAVQLLRGERASAKQHFDRYLSAHASEPESFYQVASNYALANDPATAIKLLQQAVSLDERIRLRIRADVQFDYYQSTTVGDAFRLLLNTDTYLPPKDALRASAGFPDPYDSQDRILLNATLVALRDERIPHEPTIEAGEQWALIWGAMRIKVASQDDGTGIVSITAPAGRMPAAEFHRTTQRLFRAVHDQLAVMRFRR